MDWAKGYLIKEATRWGRRMTSLVMKSGDPMKWLARHGFPVEGTHEDILGHMVSGGHRGYLSRKLLEQHTRARLGQAIEGSFDKATALPPAAEEKFKRLLNIKAEPQAAVSPVDPMPFARKSRSGIYRVPKPAASKMPGYDPATTAWRGLTLNDLLQNRPRQFFTAHPVIAGGYAKRPGEVVMEVPRTALEKEHFFTPHYARSLPSTRAEALRRGEPQIAGRSSAGNLADYETVSDLDPAKVKQFYTVGGIQQMPGAETPAQLAFHRALMSTPRGLQVPMTGENLRRYYGKFMRTAQDYTRPLWRHPLAERYYST